MTITEHILTCLSEECVEVSKEIHKALRFGLEDRNPLIENAPTQREMIVDELNDLMGVAEMLCARGIIPEDWWDERKQFAKSEKVHKYIDYAVAAGAIQ